MQPPGGRAKPRERRFEASGEPDDSIPASRAARWKGPTRHTTRTRPFWMRRCLATVDSCLNLPLRAPNLPSVASRDEVSRPAYTENSSHPQHVPACVRPGSSRGVSIGYRAIQGMWRSPVAGRSHRSSQRRHAGRESIQAVEASLPWAAAPVRTGTTAGRSSAMTAPGGSPAFVRVASVLTIACSSTGNVTLNCFSPCCSAFSRLRRVRWAPAVPSFFDSSATQARTGLRPSSRAASATSAGASPSIASPALALGMGLVTLLRHM